MYMTFGEFLEKKNEAINMRKAIIAGTSGALVALGCSGPNCPDKNHSKQQVNQVEEMPSEKNVVQKSKKQEAEKQEKIIKQKEKERKKKLEKLQRENPGWQKPKNILGT